ncbi:MAG: hypothetical protein RR795_01485 [Cetobacterium sp.]|uniref:hypothetical protein n=1 Tax=Cetobacterium sp. TaxID=2071632 RepID=UPI002FC91183
MNKTRIKSTRQHLPLGSIRGVRYLLEDIIESLGTYMRSSEGKLYIHKLVDFEKINSLSCLTAIKLSDDDEVRIIREYCPNDEIYEEPWGVGDWMETYEMDETEFFSNEILNFIVKDLKYKALSPEVKRAEIIRTTTEIKTDKGWVVSKVEGSKNLIK